MDLGAASSGELTNTVYTVMRVGAEDVTSILGKWEALSY